MKLICVGAGPCRCLVLRFRKANILLDCSTPLSSALSAIGGDGSQLDAPDTDGGGNRHGNGGIEAFDTTIHEGGIANAQEAKKLASFSDPVLAPAPRPFPSGGVAGSDANSAGVTTHPLLDLTPFLPLLSTIDLHAALISSPEALLALPHLLLQYAQDYDPYGTQADVLYNRASGGVTATSPAGRRGAANPAAAVSSAIGPFPQAAWHHLGPIRGPVYCTQAALDAAEQLVAERLAAEEALAAAEAEAETGPLRRPPGSTELGWEPLSDVQEALLATCWRRRAPWHAVRYCLDRVRPVRYGQVVPLDSYELTAVPYPSGSGFGHAVWQIADGSERCRTVLYLPDAAPSHPFAPPLPLELVQAPDALVLGPDCLGPPTPSNAPPPRPPHQAAKEAVLRAVAAGGSVLIPVFATGEAWELLESLAGALASADLAAVPLLYVGPRSGTSLALASVSLEALAPERQAAVYVPQHPFAFDALIQAGRLVTATSLRDPEALRYLQQQEQQRQPVVVLAAADSLLYPGGPALELLLRFGSDPGNLLLLPYAAPPAALRSIQCLYSRAAAVAATAAAAAGISAASAAAAVSPLRMRVVQVPLRGAGGIGLGAAGPSAGMILDLLIRLQPRHLMASQRDLALLQQQQHLLLLQRSSGEAAAQRAVSPPALAREGVVQYGWLQQVRVALPRNVQSAVVAPELLQRLQWLDAGPGLQLARLNCLLVFREGAWHAEPVPGSSTSADSVAAAAALTAAGAVAGDQLVLAATGRPTLAPLLEALAEHGLTRVSVHAEGERLRVALDCSDAELLLRPDGAHVQSSCPVMRHMLTECLMRQLTVL